MTTVADIRNDSNQVRDLDERVHSAFLLRDRSDHDREQWRAACAEFHRDYDRLSFPGGERVLAKVKAGDPWAAQASLLFLEADPFHFRSGYLKEYLWHLMPRQQFSEEDIERLEGVGLSYLHRRIGREFWYMSRAMVRIATPTFWKRVAKLVTDEDRLVATRSSYLLAYSAGINAGERVHYRVSAQVLREKYARRQRA